jgi:ABC-type bacteriocin/lantibiotic exporter with double-glycine peptidase domain
MKVSSHLNKPLWTSLSHSMLSAARFLGLKPSSTLYIPHAMPLPRAIATVAQSLNLGHNYVKKPLGGLPLLAFSRTHQGIVLLLPHGPDKFIYANKIISKNNISNYFSEIIELYRADISNNIALIIKNNFPLSALLGLVVYKIILLIIIITTIVNLEDLQNRYILLFLIVSALLLLISAHKAKNIIVGNYYKHISLWAHYQLLARIFHLDAERFAELSYATLHRALKALQQDIKAYFITFPELISMYMILLINIIIYLLTDIYIFIGIFIITILSIIINHFMARQSEELRGEEERLEHNLDKALGVFEHSFAMAVGLKAHTFIIERIKEQSDVLIAHAHRKALLRIRAFLLSLCAFLVLVGVISTKSSLLLILSALIHSFALAYLFKESLRPRAYPLRSTTLAYIQKYSRDGALRVAPVALSGAIEVHDISFAYKKSSLLIIKNATLRFEAKKFYALRGASGSGKSTLLKLLMAQEIAQEGHIAFDGQDIRSLDRELLNRHFGVIRQESKSFAGSIRANIMCGRDIAVHDVEDLLYEHEIFDLLLDLPMGLETYIYEGAKNISRVQLITILLARALVHKPKVLFLDEIFVGLSSSQQRMIADYLYSLDITRILVSHDLFDMHFDEVFTRKDWHNDAGLPLGKKL